MSYLSELIPYIAPAVVVIGGARVTAGFLWQKFDHKLNQNRDEIMEQLGQMSVSQARQDARLDAHDERLAWLEGKMGQPLHSTRTGGAREIVE